MSETLEKDGMLEIRIRDEGTGMDEETRDRLFHIDKNISHPGTEAEQGTGSDFLSARNSLKNIMAVLRVESEPGEGSCFIIDIPLSPRKITLFSVFIRPPQYIIYHEEDQHFPLFFA
ncbi:MAG: ATP-binding protein [Candidatus Marinimicrobia bacterium]|nr:ATP-binding protein [Candidatus Neomarinimicrobiota bacterium]